MARDHSIKGIRYWDCDICDFTVRWSDTTINEDGRRVCPKCKDEPSHKLKE